MAAAIEDFRSSYGAMPAGRRPETLFGLAAHATPVSIVKTVTPGLARLLLSFNQRNREVYAATVETYAQLMLEGQWKTVSSAISFTADGLVGNGQHRLLGVVASGVPCEFVLAFGMPPDSIFAEDRGRRRNLADDLGLDGYGRDLNGQQKKVLAAAGRLVWQLDHGRLPWTHNPFPTEGDLIGSLRRHPTVKRSVVDHYVSSQNANLAPAVATAFFGLFIEAHDAKGREFARRLVEADSLVPGTTLHTLHRLCTGSGSKRRLSNRNAQMVLLVRAWNNYRSGRDVAGLQSALKDGKFPEIEGLHYDDGGRLQPRG